MADEISTLECTLLEFMQEEELNSIARVAFYATETTYELLKRDPEKDTVNYDALMAENYLQLLKGVYSSIIQHIYETKGEKELNWFIYNIPDLKKLKERIKKQLKEKGLL